jgi:hypothetical protein
LANKRRGRDRRRVGQWLLLSCAAALLGSTLALAAPRHGRTPVERARAARPVNTSPPTISGSAQTGHQLTASPGTWTPAPTSFHFQWTRCGGAVGHCRKVRGSTSPTYVVSPSDGGSRLRVTVVAFNQTRRSRPANSAPTEAVPGAGALQLEYVLEDGRVSVYDINRRFKLVHTIRLPQTEAGVRGVTVAPATHLMFISYGGDGGGNGNGSVLAYDLVGGGVVWDVHLNSGIDSGWVSPDGSKLYMPTGEMAASGIWNVLSTANGSVIGTIQGGAGAHNTIASGDGRYVYLGGRNHNYLDVYETATGHVREVGPLEGGVRPFTVNAANTLAFTTATGFSGFQVSQIQTGKVLFTVSFGPVPSGFPYSAPSHGASLSPDGKQLYVIDAVHKAVQAWDVSRAGEGVAPTRLGVIAVSGLNGSESRCAYDCAQDGWVQHSRDGRFVFVGDSGDVIDTAARAVVAKLPTLANTRKSIEVDWQSGVPVATSGRNGVGY